MKKIFLTIVVTMLVMLVIGNGLALVYLSYQFDNSQKEIEQMKYALASAGIDYNFESTTQMIPSQKGVTDENSVTIEESKAPKTDAVEKLEDNKKYNEYLDMGIEKIDVIAKELPDYYAFMALCELLNVDIEKLVDEEWNNDKEVIEDKCEKAWEKVVSLVAKDIFDIMNSDEDLDSKLKNVKEYGNLAYPVMENINDVLRDDEEVKFSKCKLKYEFSLKEKNEIKDYVNDCALNADEIDVLSQYLEYVAD